MPLSNVDEDSLLPPSTTVIHDDEPSMCFLSPRSSRHSDSFFSLEDLSIHEDELDADVIEQLRPYGVRFIRDLRKYRHCECSVPPLIAQQFRESTGPVANALKDANDPMPFCFQLLPNREDFAQDPYGDLFLQDFFVERNSRGFAAGVLHFAGMFANLEYDPTLREYSVLNLAGKATLSFSLRGDKEAFKLRLVEFVREHSLAARPAVRCPNVNLRSRLLVLSYPIADKPVPNGSPTRDKPAAPAHEPNALVSYVVRRRDANQFVEFPSYLLYMANWLTHTIDEQFANFVGEAALRSIVTNVPQLKHMTDSEIAAEDDSGVQIPSVVSYRAVWQARPASEPVAVLQRDSAFRSSGRMRGALRCTESTPKCE